ncbi:hypothetical protein BCV70DRAFT_162624 [Testicularia cyperi]|uniref:Uncharacterized protein n=1 Tax=Testicularia cyperi TaxID=1882483 RepID=A0A317XMA7_9BASI|nr:hypothetical protein BCV70DRAFT_162624 [Testicularia cyperi]
MSSDKPYTALSPRFDIDEEPGDLHDGVRQPWIGAFERVLGDQESLAHDRPTRAAAKAVLPTNPVIGASDSRPPRRSMNDEPAASGSHAAASLSGSTGDNARSTAASVASSSSAHSSGHSSPALRGTPADVSLLKPVFDEGLSARSLPLSLDGETSEAPLQRYRTNSSNGSASVTSLPPSSVASTHNASSYTSTGQALSQTGTGKLLGHSQPQQHAFQLHVGPPNMLENNDLRLEMHGPSHISVSVQDCLRFEQSYVNHAPCIHHVKVSNRHSDQSVIVRLESDLRHGMSFMRRKRSAPKNEFDPVAWPSNSVAWASKGGFVPANLRGWRHVIANLENADSFILDPHQSTNVYVVLRPGEFVDEAEADRLANWPFRAPPSPTASSMGRLEPTTLSSADATSPLQHAISTSSSVSTPAAIPEGGRGNLGVAAGSDHDSVGMSGTESALASPRSAPELHAHRPSRPKTPRPLHTAFGLRGAISVSVWALPNLESEFGSADAAVLTEALHATSSGHSQASAPPSRPASFYSSHVPSSSTASSSVSALRNMPDEREIQRIRIPVVAQCCRPFIDAAIASMPVSDAAQSGSSAVIELDFGDVIVGQSHSQTLALRNLSEIDGFCQIRLEEADNMLQSPPIRLLDADSGDSVPSVWAGDQESTAYNPLSLLPLESKRLQISLTPQEPCRDYEQILTITSLHDTSNSIRVVIRANMLGTAKDDALTVLSGDYLDFGDCYGGHWTKQLLVLKNSADVLLDVSFGIQKGYEVMFQLAELAPQAEDEAREQDDIPPSALSSDLTLSSSSEDDRSRLSVSHAESSAGNSHLIASSRQSEASYDQGGAGSEMAKTPTWRAQNPAADGQGEPPKLDLSDAQSSVNSSRPCSRGRLGKGTDADSDENDEDGVDASSVASQAGSRSNSPVRHDGETTSADLSEWASSSAGESVPADAVRLSLGRGEAPHLNLMDRVHSGRSRSVVSACDHDQASVSTNQNSQTSSGFLSRPASRGRPSGASLAGDGAVSTDDARSAVSEHTALSQDSSRLGPYPATSSHAGSSTNSARHHQHRSSPAAALSGLRHTEHAQSNQLEELLLRPGGEYRVVVSYRPQRVPWDETFSGGRLVERSFRISLDYARARTANTRSKGGRERRTVVCHSRTCTSFISISPKMIDLGEVQVGTRKSANISVTNRSELTARVDLRFVSKVLSMYKGEVAIPALQTVDLKVESFPRRVNESYRKQITVANLLNRQGDQIFEVRSHNVDKQRISFHSLFYRILTPTGSNFVDFGDVNINSMRMRTFTIENVSKKKLSLELTPAHPEDVSLYIKATPPSTAESSLDGSPSLEAKSAASATRTGSALPSSAAAAAAGATGTTEGKNKSGKPLIKGADLKERFLETISVDSPTSIRTENASWRLAQKHSHFRKKEDGSSVALQRKNNGFSKPKAPINLVAALKKGGKGRITVAYGKTATFKDRTLISEFEYLDLATGPPVDARRIPAKSKKYALLENIVTGGKPKSLGLATSARAQVDASDAKDREKSSGKSGRSSTGREKDKSKSRHASNSNTNVDGSSAKGKSSGSSSPPHDPDSSSSLAGTPRRLPSPLARDIAVKGTTTSFKSTSSKAQPSTPAIRSGGKGSKEAKADTTARVHFSPALTGKRKASPVLSNPVDVSRMSIEDLLAAVEGQNSVLSTFFLGSPESEEQFVRTEINLQRELQSSIDAGKLIPLEVLELPAHSERQVVAVYHPSGSTRPHIQGNARKQDSRIFMRLIEFDVEAVKASAEFSGMAELEADELPVRDLMLRSNTCKSLLELGQPHINFGHMEKGDSKTRRILIQNRSEWALRYCIRKSGSIASGDIKLSSGRYGVVPGYGKREVEFVFSPSMSGQFQEKLVVENVADRDNDQTVVLKANVRKVPNFAVDPGAINFGACSPGKLSTPESFVLTNTTSKSRSFVIAIDSHDLLHQRCLIDVGLSTANDGEVRGTLSKEEEEEIENISQKLKIASRKGNADKIKKYEERLAALGVKPSTLTADTTAAASNGGPNSAPLEGGDTAVAKDAEQQQQQQPPKSEEQSASTSGPGASSGSTEKIKDLKRVSSTVTCTLGANQSRRLILRVRPSAVQSAIPSNTDDPSDRRTEQKAGMEEISVPVQVHEVKNQDETKTVMLLALVEFDLPCTGHGHGHAGSTTAPCNGVATTEPFPADAVVFSPLSD